MQSVEMPQNRKKRAVNILKRDVVYQIEYTRVLCVLHTHNKETVIYDVTQNACLIFK